jgi:RNA polymerase sigma-70 factor (ECF subfamily)
MTKLAPQGDAATEAATATVTLGDLLYADPSKARVSEDSWVELVHGVASGDQSALRALYERSHRLAFTLIMRITRNRETTEELTLDVFHDVWRRASQYDPANGTVLGWIMNQARSRAIDRLRSQNRQKRAGSPLAEPADGTPDCGEALDRAALAGRLREAVALLPAGERAAVEAAFFAGATHAEIAALLDEPLGTIKTRIRSALQKLRLELVTEKETT